jgi:hypothetical protein
MIGSSGLRDTSMTSTVRPGATIVRGRRALQHDLPGSARPLACDSFAVVGTSTRRHLDRTVRAGRLTRGCRVWRALQASTRSPTSSHPGTCCRTQPKKCERCVAACCFPSHPSEIETMCNAPPMLLRRPRIKWCGSGLSGTDGPESLATIARHARASRLIHGHAIEQLERRSARAAGGRTRGPA